MLLLCTHGSLPISGSSAASGNKVTPANGIKLEPKARRRTEANSRKQTRSSSVHHVTQPLTRPLWPEVEVASTPSTRSLAVECRDSGWPLLGPASHRSIPVLHLLSSSSSFHVNVRQVDIIPHLKTRSHSDYSIHFNPSLRPRILTLHHGFKRFQAGPPQAPRVSDIGHNWCRTRITDHDPCGSCTFPPLRAPSRSPSPRSITRSPLTPTPS